MAEPEKFQKTPKKAGRWFRAFIIFSLLFGITFSLNSFFNWMFFFAAVYSLFMSYFLLPEQPKIFQKRAQPNYRQPNYSQPTSAQDPAKVRRRVIFSIIGVFIFVMVFIPFLIGVIEGFSDESTVDTDTEIETESESETNTTAMSLVDTGNDFFNQQQYDSAEKYYNQALSLDPDFMSAVYGKGIVAYNRGNIDEANRYFLKAYEGNYRYAWLSWALADMYEKQGQTFRAISFYKESLSLDSTYTESYKRLADLEPANREKYLKLAEKYPSN